MRRWPRIRPESPSVPMMNKQLYIAAFTSGFWWGVPVGIIGTFIVLGAVRVVVNWRYHKRVNRLFDDPDFIRQVLDEEWKRRGG